MRCANQRFLDFMSSIKVQAGELMNVSAIVYVAIYMYKQQLTFSCQLLLLIPRYVIYDSRCCFKVQSSRMWLVTFVQFYSI